uniref:ShlB/FhaC/HecB family hemolysin secretion/activation protein n=1 Tax=Sphingobium sp. CCH11-B1 TaxID=1768781 RepID=UPI000A6BE37B
PSVQALTGLTVTGSSIAQQLEAAVRPFLGQTPDATRLQQLARALDAAYARSDVAIYMIDIQEIDRQGRLQVKAREGQVQRLRFTGLEDGIGRRVRMIAAPLGQGDGALSRRQLDRVLRLVQAIPGARVEATMVAGTVPGGVEIHFHVEGDLRRFGLLLHNDGQALTGRAQAQATAQGNSVLRRGDQMMVQGMRGLNGRVWTTAAAYTLPLGRQGAAVDMSAAASGSELAAYRLGSDAYGLGAGLTYPLLVDKEDWITAAFSVSRQSSGSHFAGYRLYRETTTSLSAALRWQHDTPRAVSSIQVKATRSAPFAAVRISAQMAARHFTKLEAQVSHDRMIGRSAALRLRAHGQYSPDPLTQADGMALGGPSFGRAYDPATLVGDSALAGSAELLWSAASGKGRDIQLYGALDAARAYYKERPIYRSGRFDLASAGAGVRVQQGRVNLDLSAHRALLAPYPGYEDRWRVRINVGLALP